MYCIASQKFGVEGFTTSLHDSLCEITDYFQTVYKSAEVEVLQQATDDQEWVEKAEEIADISEALHTVLRKANPHKVAGMDGIQIAYLKVLPKSSIDFLSCIFHKALQQRKVPQFWLLCKMTCIPKRLGRIAVNDLRPLTIAPVLYRVFCKTILYMQCTCQFNIPKQSVGGIAKRSAYQAWLPAAIACESTWKLQEQHRALMQGVSIDTEKFFDNVPQSTACQALASIGMTADAVSTWFFMISRISRFTSLNGAIFKESFRASIGVPQGDPLSMLAAAALLGQWTTEIPPHIALAKVFVDDRLLLSSNSADLLQAFHTTQIWDDSHGFRTQAKTVAFGNNLPDDNIWWMDATEVKRQKLVIYLGIPLPLKGISSQVFFEPILQKVAAVLNKIIRARLTHENAVEVIARKVIPALCYPCPAARPNKAQIASLRTKIFAAATNRQCQTLDAHALWNERTHVFDPQCAMVFHNMRFWRNVYKSSYEIIADVKHLIQNGIPLNQRLFGPVTILQKDIDWLDCHFEPEQGILTHADGQICSFQEPNKGKFEHFIRNLIRIKLAKQLQQKHERWDGIERADFKTTTAFVRTMAPSCPLKVPLVRLFSNAHATPYRLYQMGVFPTPHCRFCFHERADEEHVIWHCPRFSRVRQEWPEVLQQSSHWPNCARHAMIFTSCMDQTLKPQWASFQKLVAELLYQWMEMNRNSELYHLLPLDAAGDSEALPVQQNDILTSKQKSLSATSSLLPLTWDPPVCRTAINKWGASMQDFYLIFSFWARISVQEQPLHTPILTWSHALAIFVQVGGCNAPFLASCQNLGMAAYKFRVLSQNLLRSSCATDDIADIIGEPQEHTKWMSFLATEPAFPAKMWFSAAWDLTQGIQNIHQLYVDIRVNEQCNSQAIRIPTHTFVQAIPKAVSILQDTPLSADWALPRLLGKGPPPPWVAQILQIRSDPDSVLDNISCVTQLPLRRWKDMTALEIKNTLKGRPGPRKKFTAAANRLQKFQLVLENYHQKQLLGEANRTHVVAPSWTSQEQCHFCGRLLHFSVEPRTLMRSCNSSSDLPDDTFRSWNQQYNDLRSNVASILLKLQ